MTRSLLGLLVASCATACSSAPPSHLAGMPSAPGVSEQALHQAAASNQFAFDLYRGLATPGQNLFLSPYSVSSALAITYAGTAGNTAQQMASALKLQGAPAVVDGSFKELNDKLSANEQTNGIQLSLANRVWGQTGFPFKATFLQTVTQFYGQAFAALDFRADAEGSRHTINQWVEDQTNDKITNLLPAGSVTPVTSMVVTNAVYFKAAWEEPFDENGTAPSDFAVGGTTPVQVPTMHAVHQLNYAEDATLDAKIVELPYRVAYNVAAPHQVSMIAFVPNRADGLGALLGQLDQARVDTLTAQLTPKLVALTLPKFKVESALEMSSVLQTLGIHDLFDPDHADLSNLVDPASGEKLHVSKVIHKTFINLDESGTEAAAATGVIIGASSAPGGDLVSLKIDRPFVYLIRDDATGTILFLGQVVDPRPAG